MTTVPVPAPSFDFRPLGRMFWKEYRQQRTLWGGVLVSGICLQLIARIVMSVTPFPDMQPPQALLFLYIIPLYLVPFFLIASTAMLFALEREERTSDWLLNLSAPPWPTLLAKSGSAIAGAVSLLLVMWLWAAVLSVGSGFEFKNSVNTGTSLVGAALELIGVLSLVGTGILLWGTLGSLTSRRVVTAVPAALVWWMAIYLVPMVTVIYLSWLRYGRMRHDVELYLQSLFPSFVAVCFLGTATLNVHLGLRWCRGQYLDASWLEELNERLTAMLPWNRGRSSRVPVAIESEHSGWRTWQRLVWQERHRESLHTGLLVIVCATSVLLALYSLADQESSITFTVIPFLVALPCAMGVIGFRFDAGGQQLRFLANRGTSPTMIWLAKHVVWLPRAFWVPAVCWAVACLVEWAFIPWSGSLSLTSPYSVDGASHPLGVGSFFYRRHFFDVLWFILMSYAVGQAAAMLIRRMILAIGAGLMATILLIWWQVLVASVSLPRGWAVGGIAVWLLCLSGWYSRHWLIERRSWPVVKRLAAGLLLPPLLLLFGAALYRWLEIPGLGPSSPTLMALLYPRETERRESIVSSDISGGLREIQAAVNAVTQPTSPESRAVRDRLISVNNSYRPLSQIRVSPELVASLPSDASREQQDRAARERFWSFNEQALVTITEVLSKELPVSYRTQRTAMPYEDATPNPQLLLDAGRLSMEEDHPQQAFRYYMSGLRLARCFASQNVFANWVAGRERQAEILQSLVEWSNHEDVTREMLFAAINQTRDELSRYPTLREASAAEFVLGFGSEKWMRWQLNNPDDPASLRFAKNVAVMLVPQETARMMRENEQRLYWRWHLYGSLEGTMQMPGFNALQQFVSQRERLTRGDEPGNEWRHTVFQSEYSTRFGKDLLDIVIACEVVNRQALLALALVLCKTDHAGALPSSLDELAVYCQIHGRDDPQRVLPVMAMNDPWTGAMFHYAAMPRIADEQHEPDDLNPVVLVSSAGATPMGHANRAAHNSTDNGIATVGEYPGLSIQSFGGRLSLWFPPRPQR